MARVVPSLALVAYADAWLSAAKVIVFGDALSTLPEQLIERGARLVYVYDSDPARVAEATQRSSSANVSFAPLEQAGSLARDGAFDLGIIEDIDGSGAPPARLLESLARALGRRGVALIASRNPDVQQRLIETQGSDTPPLGYYPLHELVRSHFSDVRMLGQAPFVGYAIIDFGSEAEDEINIDTALVPGGAEQPEWFVALASQHELHAEGFSVIQLPFTGVGQRGPRHVELERARASEKRALARLAKLEQEQLEAGTASQVAPASPAAVPANPAAAATNPAAVPANPAAVQAELERLRHELAEREKWLAGLEARASTADQRADDMQVELEQLRDENTARQQELERARGNAGEGLRQKRLEDDKNVLRQELLALRKQLDEQRRQHEEQRRANEEQRRQQDDGKRQQDESRRQLEDSRRQLEELRKQHDDGKRQQDESRRQLEELRHQHEQARRQSEEAVLHRDDARRQLDEQRKQHEQLKRRHDEELARQTKSSAEQESLRKALAEARAKLEERSERVAILEQQLSEGGSEPAQEVALLEEQLVERGREVARLEQAIAETERFGKQLIVQLEALKQGPGDAGAARFEKLTQRNAELEANVEALRWSVAQLQASSAESPRPSDADGNVQHQAVLLEQARPVTG